MIDSEIIRADSPLRRVPEKLHHRQRLFVDGVRYSIEMADIAYTRLCRAAFEIGFAERDPSSPAPHFTAIPAMMLDAWSVVDCVHRLRTLVRAFPGLSNFPWKALFLRQTEPVTALRNCVQHLAEQHGPDAEANDLPWGQLSWIAGPVNHVELRMPRVIAGALAFKLSPPTKIPESFASPIDRLLLSAFGNELNLSEVMQAVRNMAGRFETVWQEQTPELGAHLAADLIVSVDLRPAPNGAATGA